MTDEKIKSQWYPYRLEKIKDSIIQNDGKSEKEASEIIERLEILQNIYYVLEIKY